MKTIRPNRVFGIVLCLLLLSGAVSAHAQTTDAAVVPAPAADAVPINNVSDAHVAPQGEAPSATSATAGAGPSAPASGSAPADESVPAPAVVDLNRAFRGSLFFTDAEVALIQQAMLGAPVTSFSGGGVSIAQRRFIRLSGVLWRGKNDWIVWVNGYKVTPKYILPEIVSMNVKRSSKVRFKWYDLGLDEVLDVTLRPHQVYDITSGMLLPGSE